VNQNIVARPSLLAAAKNGEKGDNQTALAIAGLESQALPRSTAPASRIPTSRL
jgi:hypothetical protein